MKSPTPADLAALAAREIEGRTPPDACASMAEVRAGVDALDRALAAILAERQRYMDAAARLKHSRDDVRDEARIRDVLDKVGVVAAQRGLAPEIAEPVWRTLVERCIAYEFEAFDRRRG